MVNENVDPPSEGDTMNDAQIQAIADRVLRDALGKFRYERAEIRSGLDYSDEPAVYVYAVLGEGAPQLEPKVLMNANVALSDALLAQGEDRFPYLETRRLDDDDRPEDDTTRSLRGHS
jgi:hypothetical protein